MYRLQERADHSFVRSGGSSRFQHCSDWQTGIVASRLACINGFKRALESYGCAVYRTKMNNLFDAPTIPSPKKSKKYIVLLARHALAISMCILLAIVQKFFKCATACQQSVLKWSWSGKSLYPRSIFRPLPSAVAFYRSLSIWLGPCVEQQERGILFVQESILIYLDSIIIIMV